MLVEVILGVLGEAALGYAGSTGRKLFQSRKAKEEIAEIGAASIEAGIAIIPALTEDLRSVSFIKGVFVPVLEACIEDPSKLPDPIALADQFVDMFVARFSKASTVDEVLRRIFQTERSDLKSAFVAMLSELRSQFYKSEHWREVGHYTATETTVANTTKIIRLLESLDRERELSTVDLDTAKKDAKTGSDELRAWPRDIKGWEIFRPELDQLKNHINAGLQGTSLLIGEAGSGKSALLSKLTEELELEGHVVFGIKADTLPASVATFDDIGQALGMAGPLALELAALAQISRVILIIDQLDAVSDVMDRSSERMRILLRLVRQVRDQALPVHVVVSSRPFEAAHDARFQQLRAEEFTLSLPSTEDTLELLKSMGIESADFSDQLKEVLRRPFALKLFVESVQRGVDPASVESGNLLDRWLVAADLGPDALRHAVLDLMHHLASEMLTTETLWRPVDVFEASAKEALARAEACGLLIRSGQKIGFSHQSWLDDFQAKSFSSGHDLADYAWRNQDRLFVRATVLRSLQRLRAVDHDAYARSVSSLLWDTRTRRHLKHLVVDVISTICQPSAQEGAWVDALIRTDLVLANRALGKAVEHWPGWRSLLSKCLPILMGGEEFRWRAVQVLAAEAKVDPDSVVTLVKSYWDTPDKDQLVFRVVEESGVITEKIEELISRVLNRTSIDHYAVSHFVEALRDAERFREACRVVAIWIRTIETDRDKTPTLYGVEKLAEKAPVAFAEELLPWFLQQATKEVAPFRDGVKRFPQSQSLPWDWGFDRGHDKVIEAFRSAMNATAATDPEAAARLIEKIVNVDVDQVQEVAAQAYMAGGAVMVLNALDFLLADERRFCIGDADVTLEPGLSSMVSGLTSQELVEAVALHLPIDRLANLRDRIESWSLYDRGDGTTDEPDLRRKRLRWADEHRMELLERLPSSIISARRSRQIKEWRVREGKPIARECCDSMVTIVGSPMSAEAMARAHDDDIFGMIDEVNDTSPERSRRRPLSRDGGVIELSRSFAAFGKDHAKRAVALVRSRFEAGKHEHAAGELVEELSKEEIVSPDQLLQLIDELSERGFSSTAWTHDASLALARISDKISGLPDTTIALLESWLENDPDVIAEQTERRLANEAENQRRNRRDRSVPGALLFHRFGGMRLIPQGNYTILSAIFHGLMGRKERAYDPWLRILEGHASKAEDPMIWSFLLSSEGKWLFWADRPRVQSLLSTLWGRDPRTFMDIGLVRLLWTTRAMFPEGLMLQIATAWFASEDERFRQAAAELAQAFLLVVPEIELSAKMAKLLKDAPSPELTGRLFTAASAWKENEPSLRKRAHKLLTNFAPAATGDQAHAISSAVNKTDTLIPDDLTRELILLVADYQDLLASSLTGSFADGLQSLLLYPGFDEPVMYVTERIAEMIIGEKGGQHRGFIDRDFVQITIALQRNNGPLRARAMDVYEKLLDAGAYGAEEAAKAAIGR